jgi:hypothetical protein
VKTVNSWLSSNGYSTQVTAAGDADMENASGWASASNVQAWGNAFSSVSSYTYYDSGSANGCPDTDVYDNASCNAGWNQYDEWYASWAPAAAWPAPEDYNQTYYCPAQGCGYGWVDPNSRQWEAIDRYGYHYQSSHIIVAVVVTQQEACAQVDKCGGVDNTTAEGDSNMYNALNHDWAPNETGQSIRWTTDFEWGYVKA